MVFTVYTDWCGVSTLLEVRWSVRRDLTTRSVILDRTDRLDSWPLSRWIFSLAQRRTCLSPLRITDRSFRHASCTASLQSSFCFTSSVASHSITYSFFRFVLFRICQSTVFSLTATDLRRSLTFYSCLKLTCNTTIHQKPPVHPDCAGGLKFTRIS